MTSMQSNSTVFFVDDEPEMRRTLVRALSKRGYRVVSFASAAEFLETYDPQEPGCLVLDYGMPDLNGLELQQVLNERGVTIPIIFVSGHGGVPESVQAMKAGAVDFLEKPFRQHVLVDCIEKAFEKDLARRHAEAAQNDAKTKFDMLTNREKEIALFMLNNPSTISSKDIGRQLNISPRTVDHHRASILKKTGSATVAELINGLLSISVGSAGTTGT